MTVTGQPLVSSAIAYAEYDDETQELTLEFVSGTSATYSLVPRDVYDALVRAPSPGRYFQSAIKGVY